MNIPSSPKQTPVVGLEHRPNLQPYTEEEVHFEIDMCIGCDRCMRACPIPMSSTITIVDLNRATISDDILPEVARFTQECVMCGSCVPVCPVDNHRDLLMLWLKQRLGVAWDGNVDLNHILDYLPPGWDVPVLLRRLRELPLFSDAQAVSDNYLLHLAVSSKLLTLLPGEVLLHEGEFGRDLYLILEGRFFASSAGPDGADLPVAVERRGEYLGEQGLLSGQPRDVTARAETAALVLEVPEQAMQQIMQLVPEVRRYFDQVNDARSLEAFITRLDLFQGISAADRRWLAGQTQIKWYDRDEPLFSEAGAQMPARETMHFVLEGFVKVARRTTAGTGHDKTDERIIAYRQKGDYFAGGLDVLGDGRAVSVTAITRVNVAEAPGDAIHTLLARYPAVNARFTQRLRQYRETTTAMESVADPVSTPGTHAGLHALVGGGVIEGTEVLVIDLEKCIQCDQCEDACARRHGHSRMNRKGMVVGNISIATACRHCQDPVCMLCSRAGIARLPSGEVYITESCIGCGICAERCPYDNISIMTLEAEVEARSAWQQFSGFFTKGSGKERGKRMLPILQQGLTPGPLNTQQPLDAFGELRKKLAIKCDLCAGYNNQACVQACPTGAAIRVQPASFFGSTEEILRTRAN